MRTAPRQNDQLRTIGGCLRSAYELKCDGEMTALLVRLSAIKSAPGR